MTGAQRVYFNSTCTYWVNLVQFLFRHSTGKLLKPLISRFTKTRSKSTRQKWFWPSFVSFSPNDFFLLIKFTRWYIRNLIFQRSSKLTLNFKKPSSAFAWLCAYEYCATQCIHKYMINKLSFEAIAAVELSITFNRLIMNYSIKLSYTRS